MITLLEGNQLVSLNPIEHKNTVFDKGSIFTINGIQLNPKTHSVVCFTLDEIEGISFGEEVEIFTDRFNLNDHAISTWFNDDKIR